MEPTPDKEEPEATPPSRGRPKMGPKGRKNRSSDKEMDDLGDLEDLESLDDLEDLEAIPPRTPKKEKPGFDEDLEDLEDLEEGEIEPGESKKDDEGPLAELEDEVEELEDDEEELEDEDDEEELEDDEEELEDDEEELEDDEEELEDDEEELEDDEEELEDDEEELGLEDDEEPQHDRDEKPKDVPKAVTESEPEESSAKTPQPAVEEGKGEGTGISRRDLIWMGVLALVLLGGIFFFVSLVLKNFNTKDPGAAVDFPIKGENVSIARIETFWRKPNREVDQGVRLDANLIPCASIAIKSGSGSGALRFFFKDPDGNNIGDSVTRAFSGGTFTDSGSDEVEVYSTGGMEDEGQYAAYLTEELHFWHLIVFEGPGPKAEGREFKEILKMRVSSNRR